MGSMDRELSVGRQKMRSDRESTIALYRDTITIPGTDQCSCISCQNFAAQRGKTYPDEFLRFLEKLGIDPIKEWEAFDYDFGPDYPPRRLYGGWFLFCGELVEGFDEGAEAKPDSFAGFTTSFPAGTLPAGVKLCAVEFLAQIPWVLPNVPG